VVDLEGGDWALLQDQMLLEDRVDKVVLVVIGLTD
jgi:hypothetical protein